MIVKIERLTDIFQYIGQYDGIIFDLDDTLYLEKDYVRSGYHEIARVLEKIPQAEERLWNFFESGKNAIDCILEEEGIFSEELKQKCLQAYRFQKPDIALEPEVKDLLARIKSEKQHLGIITDGRVEGQWAKIRALGLEKYTEDIMVTDELGGAEYRKPCSLAYEQMQKKWKIPYTKMVYIGDNAKKDFVAPEKLGMGAIWFLNPNGLYYNK